MIRCTDYCPNTHFTDKCLSTTYMSHGALHICHTPSIASFTLINERCKFKQYRILYSNIAIFFQPREMHKLCLFREDGRRSNELRDIHIKTYDHYTHLKQGNTQIRVKIDGPKEGTKLFFNVTFNKTSRQDQISDKRVYEYEAELYSIFQSIIICDHQIEISVEVIQEDGSLISAMVNCVTLALCQTNISMIDFPCSVTYHQCGIDLSSVESGKFVCVVYLLNRKKIVYLKSVGRVTYDLFRTMNEDGLRACGEIYEIFKGFLLHMTN